MPIINNKVVVTTQKEVFEVELEGGAVVKLAVMRPNYKHQEQAQKVYNKAFKNAIESGAILRDRINIVMQEQGLWTAEKEKSFQDLRKALLDNEKKLAQGGLKLWAEARPIAIQMRKDRIAMQLLVAERNNVDVNTAESQAENAKFNYLVSACTVYNDTGKPFFASYENYLERMAEPVSIHAATTLGKFVYGVADDYATKFAENKWLTKYKLVDEKLRLINKEGKLVDEDGHLIDEQGRRINAEGQPIDDDGTPYDAITNDYIVETKPFIDDETGEPVKIGA